MSITELLSHFADPKLLETLSFSDKLMAGLVTTILGMGVTFTALIILQFIISWMDTILNKSGRKTAKSKTESTAPISADGEIDEIAQDHNELVAVISAVIAMRMKTSVSNIVIKNIEKVEDSIPAWHRAGIIEQMNSRL